MKRRRVNRAGQGGMWLESPAAPPPVRHGALRFALAMAVAMSHMGFQPGGFNPGVMAVMVFYLLAGMVADKLLSLPAFASPVPYWVNRLRRIAPLYLFSLAVAAVAWGCGASSIFLARDPGPVDILANLTVIPLAYYMYTGQDAFTLIPPAWSLGVELQFYLLAPLLLTRPRMLRWLLWSSFVVFLFAVVGKLHTDHFGYRLLPGVLFVFLGGVLLNRGRHGDAFARRTLLLLWLGLAFMAMWVVSYGQRVPYNYEMLAALLAGGPLLFFFSSSLPYRVDRFLGALSYGVFLLHFPALWFVSLTGCRYSLLASLILSVVLAIFGHFLVEGPARDFPRYAREVSSRLSSKIFSGKDEFLKK